MKTITLDLDNRYKGMEKNLRFILTDKFQAGLFGGFANGKTESLCWRALLLALKHPKALGLIGRATYPELRDSTMRSFFDICPPELIKEFHRQENKITLVNGAEIIFRAFDDPRKILSMNLGWIGVDQLEEISEEMYLQMLGRLRDKECRYFFGVGNPEPNWVKTRFKENKSQDPDIVLVEATTMENPHLPADYISNLIKNYPDFWVKRYVYGDWNTFEGQIFTEFMENRDVIDPFEVPKTWRRDWLIDYGYRNPLACIKIVTDFDDNYYVIDEHYEREQIISYHAKKIKDMGYTDKEYALIDPSCKAKTRVKNERQVSIIDEFMDEGIVCLPANNDIAGTLRVNQWFKDCRLKIFRNCVNTINEVKNLRWKKVKPDWNKNIPEEEEDRNNHTTDLLKYFANSRPQASKEPKPDNYVMVERLKRLTRPARREMAWNE